MKQKIIILGAGVGGLACAHELSKNLNYEVHVYERNKEIGGQARSSINEEKKHTEYCWHAFSSSYNFFLRILNEVTDNQNIKLISHLKPLNRFIYAFENRNRMEYGNSFVTNFNTIISGFKNLYGYPVPIFDRIKLLFLYIKANTLCEKNLEKYDEIKWADCLAGISSDVRKWVLDSTSIYLGMDYANLSAHFIFNMMRREDIFCSLSTSLNTSSLINTEHVFYSLDGPMNNILFDNWKRFLEEKGIIFHLNHTVTNIDVKDNKIKEVTITHENHSFVVQGDIYVNALCTDQLAALIPTNNNKLLDINGRQVQTQVLYYLPYKLQPVGTDPTILILPDTPWFLMARIEGDLWETKEDYISTGIGIWDKPGLLGKPAINCTREELATECWLQINNSQHNLKLPENMPKWDIWYSFQFNNEEKKMYTTEPKFSNNINTFAYRPTIKDVNIINLYNATSYTKTKMNIFNMESGVEAGVNAAAYILSRSDKKYDLNASTNCFFSFCRWIDKFFS